MSRMLSEHFAADELACPCCGACTVSRRLLTLLEAIRAAWGGPLVVNSGYRCPPHNREVGGEPGSCHTTGEAADIRPADPAEADRLWRMVRELRMQGKLPLLGGLGRYRGRIHVDVRAAPDGHLREWDARGKGRVEGRMVI